MEYRVEQKFIVTQSQIQVLQSRLAGFMEADVHQQGAGYLIRSLYFDDYRNTCAMENEAGIGMREKFRIRIYNGDSGLIKLEQKSKNNQYINKKSTQISKQDCLACMEGHSPKLEEDSPYLLKKLYARMQAELFLPVTIVEYERCAYTEPVGNVRVTFDTNISGSSDVSSFFEQTIPGEPVFEAGVHILEVKYDEFLPDYIRDILQMDSLSRTSFSKYYYARNNPMLG